LLKRISSKEIGEKIIQGQNLRQKGESKGRIRCKALQFFKKKKWGPKPIGKIVSLIFLFSIKCPLEISIF
jgi:hypothetical protein